MSDYGDTNLFFSSITEYINTESDFFIKPQTMLKGKNLYFISQVKPTTHLYGTVCYRL